jgi:hypothetical protein
MKIALSPLFGVPVRPVGAFCVDGAAKDIRDGAKK